jgi:hypothetical protein
LIITAMMGRLIRAWKWNSLLRVRGIHVSTWQAIRLSWVSHFTGSWTPGQIGGDAYRVIALRQYGKPGVVVSTVLIERYAGLCAVSFFSLITMPFTVPHLYKTSPWILAIVIGAIVTVAAVIPCLLNRRLLLLLANNVPGLGTSAIGDKLRQFYKTITEYQQYRGTLVVFALATLVEVFSYFVLNYFAARSLGLDVRLWYFLVTMPIVHLLLRIPISFQGLGIQEGCFVYALVLYGFSPAEGLAVSVVQRTLEWIVSIVPGGLLLGLTTGPTPNAEADDSTSVKREVITVD